MEVLILSSRLASLEEEAISELEGNGDEIYIYGWEHLAECPLLYDSGVIVLDLEIDVATVNDRFFFDNFYRSARVGQETRLALRAGRSMIVLAARTVRDRGFLKKDNYEWLTGFLPMGVSGDSYGVNYFVFSDNEVYRRYFEGVPSYYKIFSPSARWADEHDMETLAVAEGSQLPIAIECRAGRGRVVFLPPTEKAPREAVADLYAIAKYEDERVRQAEEPPAEVEVMGPTEAQEAVRSVAEVIDQVRADVQFLAGTNLAVELEALVTQVEAQRAAASARIIDGDDTGIEELRGIVVTLQVARLDSYRKRAEMVFRQAKRRLERSLWLGNRVSIAEKLDEIENRLGALNSQRSVTDVDANALIESYRGQIGALGRILDRLRAETGRARYLVALKVFAWGFPIVIGLWFSYAPSLVKQGSFVALVLLAGLSYLLVGSALVQRVSASRLLLGGTVFVILALGVVVGYLRRVSLLAMLRQLRVGDLGLMTSMAIVGVAGALVGLMSEIMREVGRRRLHVGLTVPGRRFAPGSDIDVHFTLANRSSTVLTDVTLRVVAPGLIVPDQVEPVFKAMGARDTKEHVIRLGIPADAPEGEYVLEFEWSCYRGTQRLERTTRLPVRVVS